MKELYVVVHAEAEHHVEKVVGGWYDSNLTERGKRQALSVASQLGEQIPPNADVEIWSSDLKRAVQTAGATAELFQVDIHETPDLREISYGEAEGKPLSGRIEEYRPAPCSGDRMDHDFGIAGSETKREFAERVYRAMDYLLDCEYSHQVIFTHGFALTFVVAAWFKMPIDAAGFIHLKSIPAGITLLVEDDYYCNRSLHFLSDGSHLQLH